MLCYRAHREILVFASPFFEAALSGEWSETRADANSVFSQSTASAAGVAVDPLDNTFPFPGSGMITGMGAVDAPRRQSIASVITIPQPPVVPGDHSSREQPLGATCAPSTSPDSENGHDAGVVVIGVNISGNDDSDTAVILSDLDDLRPELEALDITAVESSASDTDVDRNRNRDASLNQLQGRSSGENAVEFAHAQKRGKNTRKGKRLPQPEAKIVLKEEKACTFHDFLKFVYPQ